MHIPDRNLDEHQVRREYPLSLGVDGWFFRIAEVSPGFFLAEGTDLRGRVISLTGVDQQELMAQCASKATAMSVRE